MKANFRPVPAIVLACLTAACGALPHTAAVRTEIVSTLVFQNGPEGAIVSIDGRETGRLSGKQTTVTISDGTHDVAVVAGSSILFKKTIFIEDGTRKVIPLSK